MERLGRTHRQQMENQPELPDALTEEFREAQCLVTGGAGFIGSNLVKALLGIGAHVTVLDNLSTGKLEHLPENGNLEVIVGDLADYEGLDRVVARSKFIFHLAAMVGNIKSIELPEEDARTNVMGSVRLYNSCRRAGSVQKVVYSSSSAMFGEAESVPIGEEHRQAPESFYALSKMSAEHYAILAHGLWKVPTICLRYFNVYGWPMEHNEYTGVISIFFDRLAKGQPLTIYGDGEQYRDFVHVSDVVQANLRAAALGKPGRVFNVGGGTKATIRDLAETMIEITGIEVPVESLDFRPGEVRRSVADVSRARRELGYEPLVDLEAGLEMMWGKVRSVDEEG